MNEPDIVLRDFFNSSGRAESEILLGDLMIARVQPVIEKTLRAKLHVSLKQADFSLTNQEALELAGDIKLLLISELQRLKSNPNGKVIYNLDGYVAAVTVNMYRQYLRSKHPQRRQLKSRLRYLLTHHPKFALWEDESAWLCGFEKSAKRAPVPDAETIRAGIAEAAAKNDLRDGARTIELVAAVFEFAKVPLFFSDLVTIVAEVQGVRERREITESETFALDDDLAVSEDSLTAELERQTFLKRVWTEIAALPVRHRAALLLNLRDKNGDCVVGLLPLLRIASVRQIAEALGFEAEDFASVWNELPWDDLKIAGYLGLTRQQVINLRQSARARLARLAVE